jgi:glycosyltransferase involved in cell wall biosynthesis
MNVVWLASWYPNRTSITNGDFIERHAKAVAPFLTSLTIIAVVKDECLPVNATEIIEKNEDNITTCIIYYGRSRWGGIIEKYLSLKKYIALHLELFDKIIKEKGKPDMVHVHVAMKAGLAAKKIKQLYNIPYIITEHWTGYYRESTPNVFEMGPLFMHLCKGVFKNSSIVLPVSNGLGKRISSELIAVNFKVVPNAVDTRHFYYKEHSNDIIRFIHPSYMHYQKNPEGILAACEMLSKKNMSFELLMIGNESDELKEKAKEKGLLNKYVFFEPAIPYTEVALKMQSSSALLLFSRFENMPCVILEALCCGLPVISTDVGGIAEVIHEQNGILVQNEDVNGLAAAMENIIANYQHYSQNEIAGTAIKLYGYDEVGRQLKAVYNGVITHSD